MVLALLAFAGGLVNHFGQQHKPEPGPRPAGISVIDAVAQRKEPDWFTLLVPVLNAAAIVIGGTRLVRPSVATRDRGPGRQG